MKRVVLMAASVLLAAACGAQESSTDITDTGVLMEPQSAEMQKQAPDRFQVLFQTSAGDFTVEVERELAPNGVDRFYNLVRHGFYDEQRFFRVLPGFVVQWGMHADPAVTAQWQTATIPDDPVKGSNTPGTLTFAKTGAPNSRSTQLFINLGDNSAGLDRQGFAPFGRVVDGMDAVQAINSEHGQTPNQQQIGMRGNEYLKAEFPALDYIKRARITD